MFDLKTPIQDLPFPVQRLPDEARALWLNTYVEVYTLTADAVKAELAAWGAIKREDLLQQLGLKSADTDTPIVAGWAMLFSDKNNPDLSEARTYFDETTETALDYYQNAPLFYEHDGSYGIIGKRTLADLYPHGIWLEHQLDPTSPHFNKIASEIEQGVLSYSTDSIEHFVQAGYNREDSHLALWYLAGCSLTKKPAEPALGPVTLAGTLNAMKSAQEARKATVSDEAPMQEDLPINIPIEEAQMPTLEEIALMVGLTATATADEVIAVIASLQETAQRTNDMTEEEKLEASRSIEVLNMMREALTVEGVVPSDEELFAMLQSALESLGGEAEPVIDTELQAQATKSVFESFRNSTKKATNKPPVHTVNDAKKSNGTKQRTGFGTPHTNPLSAKRVIAEGLINIAKGNVNAMKALGYTVGTNGGWLVNREISEELLPFYYARSVVREAGVTVVNMEGIENLEYQKQLTGATAYWAGEGQTTTDGSPTYGTVQLSLREAVAEVSIANRLLKTSAINIEGEINEDLQKALSLLMDLSALRGSGGKPTGSTGREFVGLANISGVGSTTLGSGNGAKPKPEDFVKAWGAIEDADVPESDKWAIISAPRTDRFLRNTTDTTGQLIPDVRYTQGKPVYKTTKIPVNITLGTSSDTTDVYFGAWEHMYFGSGPDIEFVTDYSVKRATRQVLIQAVVMADICVSHPIAFHILKGVRP